MKTYVIGDIHGAFKALSQLIEKIDLQKEDKLIFLGDYVDGWSENAEVIDFLIQLSTQFDCIFIKGNHDKFCIDWLKEAKMFQNWLLHGGGQTMLSYDRADDATKQLHLSFLEKCKMYHIDAMNNLYVHAGFTNGRGVTFEHFKENLFWDRTLIETALAMDKTISKNDLFYPNRLKCYKEIFIGHTPTLRYGAFKPINVANLWMMDTGAAFTGKLTALCIETKEIVQSDRVADLYPDELGRN